jgi:hypothetical protein
MRGMGLRVRPARAKPKSPSSPANAADRFGAASAPGEYIRPHFAPSAGNDCETHPFGCKVPSEHSFLPTVASVPMSKGLEVTRKAIGIIADALDKSAPSADAEAKGIVKLLRAHEAGDHSADLFETARQFNRLEVPLRRAVATSAEQKAKERTGKAPAAPAEKPVPVVQATPAPAKTTKDQKTGSSLYGVLNRR